MKRTTWICDGCGEALESEVEDKLPSGWMEWPLRDGKGRRHYCPREAAIPAQPIVGVIQRGIEELQERWRREGKCQSCGAEGMHCCRGNPFSPMR